MRDLCTGIGITWDSTSSGFQGGIGARTIPSAQISHFQGASHSTAKNTSPIVAQPARSQFVKTTTKYGLDSQGAAREQKRTSLGTNIVRVRKRA